MAIGAGASVINQSSTGFLAGDTIVRTRGLLSIMPSVFGIDLTVIGAMGFGIVSNQAFAAGAASIPGPWSNADWEGWFLHQYFAWKFEVTTDIGRLIGSVQIPFDSKAMRKMDGTSETLVVMVESQANAISASVNFRMLVKLS